jgi:abortive infection bacteriophage resistance protein
MVAEMMSFGQLSKWYSNLGERALRNRIAQPLGLPETVLVPLVRHVTDIRNICAHHGRLWNRGFRHPPKLAQNPSDLGKSLVADKQAGMRLYNGLTMIAHVVRTVAPILAGARIWQHFWRLTRKVASQKWAFRLIGKHDRYGQLSLRSWRTAARCLLCAYWRGFSGEPRGQCLA